MGIESIMNYENEQWIVYIKEFYHLSLSNNEIFNHLKLNNISMNEILNLMEMVSNFQNCKLNIKNKLSIMN